MNIHHLHQYSVQAQNGFCIVQAATALGIAPKDVIHGVNYYDTTTRDFEIDRLTYKILDMALHNAHNFCEIPQKMRSMQALISGDWEEDDDNLDFTK